MWPKLVSVVVKLTAHWHPREQAGVRPEQKHDALTPWWCATWAVSDAFWEESGDGPPSCCHGEGRSTCPAQASSSVGASQRHGFIWLCTFHRGRNRLSEIVGTDLVRDRTAVCNQVRCLLGKECDPVLCVQWCWLGSRLLPACGRGVVLAEGQAGSASCPPSGVSAATDRQPQSFPWCLQARCPKLTSGLLWVYT